MRERESPDTHFSEDERQGKTKRGRRVLRVLVCLFTCLGVAAIVVFMKTYLPQQYVLQAKEEILPPLLSSQVGDVISFGKYEQNNDRSDGEEPIEWEVLARKGARLLLISQKALDCVEFNTAQEQESWEGCSLRSWLNRTFFDAAFSGAEKTLICKVEIKPGVNPNFQSDPGGVVTDRVFLLSINESVKYFGSDSKDRKCQATAYAHTRGAKLDDEGYCIWWLRSPGFDQSVAARIQTDGSINYCGYHVNSDFNTVRPCIWITLNPDLDIDV